MALAPDQGPSATASAVSANPVGIWRLLAVAAPHLAALGVMLHTETDFGSRTGFLLSWGILNFFWIALLRRPALSGALSLTLVVVLILLSRLKHDIVQMTANFVDLMVIRAVVARSVPDPPPAGIGGQAGLSCRAGRILLRLAR